MVPVAKGEDGQRKLAIRVPMKDMLALEPVYRFDRPKLIAL